MKKSFLILFSLFSIAAIAQDEDAKTLHETAKNFIKQGDYTNAALVLNKALQKEPDNLSVLKDQALVYYLQRDYARSSGVSSKLVERKDADVQTYQIAAMSLNAT